MGHDLHFLERLDRLRHDQVSEALSFYRDHELVKSVLRELRLPEAVDRVAISLADPVEGPFIIVHRSGRFITCLGEGMHVGDTVVVSKERFDHVTKDITRAREILAEVKANPRHEMKKLIEKLMLKGDQISREEFDQIKAWYPLIRSLVFEIFAKTATEMNAIYAPLQRRITDFKKKDEQHLHRYFQGAWALSHLSLLLGTDSGSYVRQVLEIPELANYTAVISWPTVRMGVMSMAARGAWLAGVIGKPMLPYAKRQYQIGASHLQTLSAGLGLMAIGSAHRKYRAEVSKALAQNTQVPDSEVMAKVVRALRSAMAITFDAVLEESADYASGIESLGAALIREGVSKHAPEGHALKFGPDDPVPRALAVPTVLRAPFGLFGKDSTLLLHYIQWIPEIARLSNSEFFIEEKYMEMARHDWEPSHTMDLLESRRRNEGLIGRPLATPKAPPKPERNAPCPCGSQKKYKRCCALKSPMEHAAEDAAD